MTKTILTKSNLSLPLTKPLELGLAYNFGGSVHFHQGGKYIIMQAGLVLEEPTALHLDQKGTLT